MNVYLHPRQCVCRACQAMGEVRVAMDHADKYHELRRRNEARKVSNIIHFPTGRTKAKGEL